MLYLAYGSNMTRRRLEERVGACVVLGAAFLPDHNLRFHKRGRDGSGKCDAHSSSASDGGMFGVLFELTEVQRGQLDGFEGPGYHTREVRVVREGRELTAFTYIARSDHIDLGLAPFDWYKLLVVEGAREHRLPHRYVRRLARVVSVPDPDSERAARMETLLGRGPSAAR